MARRKRRRSKTKRRNVSRRRSYRPMKRSVYRRRRPNRRMPKRSKTTGRFLKSKSRVSRKRRKPARRSVARKPVRRNRSSNRRSLTNRQLAKYRQAISRYKRNPLRRYRRRNAAAALGFDAVKVAKSLPMMLVRTGGGLVSSMLAGHLAGNAIANAYGPLLGSALVLGGSIFAQMKVPKARMLGYEFTAGAGAGTYYALMNLLIQKGIVSADIAKFVAPWAVVVSASDFDAGVADGGDVVNGGTGAYVQQAALYGMGASPMEQSMRHRLNMLEQGMSGGIFDHKTTLGEYDILESAPPGTAVQSAMAEYLQYPGMGATVEQATAGMGATVQEAFAGPSLREYVQTPLGDYVNVGGRGARGWSQSAQGSAVLSEIQNAARKLTAERVRSGLPVDARFLQRLQSAAQQAVAGSERDVSMAAPVSPLTRAAAPFPGRYVGDVGGVAGQPVGIPSPDMYVDDDDGGIFG